MLRIRYEGSFKKDYKRILRRGYDARLLGAVLELLAGGEILPDKYRDHSLSGNRAGFRECHITPDWLLIYRIDKANLTLQLVRTGTHSGLF